MAKRLNSVKIARSHYHHGDLRAALIDAGEGLLGDRGVDGFSLREAARRAGVTPAAPAHHFGDVRGLLTAIATRGFVRLGEALGEADRRAGPDRKARLHAQGRAYVEFALTHPASFELMWRKAVLDPDDPAYAEAGAAAFHILRRAVEGPEPPPEDASPAVIACWAVVHGYARLALDSGLALPPGQLDAVLDSLNV